MEYHGWVRAGINGETEARMTPAEEFARAALREHKTFHVAMFEVKRAFVKEALQMSGGNVTAASRKIGIHRNNFHRYLLMFFRK